MKTEKARDLGEKVARMGKSPQALKSWENEDLRPALEEGFASGIDDFLVSLLGTDLGLRLKRSLEASFTDDRRLFTSPNELVEGFDAYKAGFVDALASRSCSGDGSKYQIGYRDAVRVILRATGLDVRVDEMMQTGDSFVAYIHGIRLGFKATGLNEHGRPKGIYDGVHEGTPHLASLKLRGIKAGYGLKNPTVSSTRRRYGLTPKQQIYEDARRNFEALQRTQEKRYFEFAGGIRAMNAERRKRLGTKRTKTPTYTSVPGGWLQSRR